MYPFKSQEETNEVCLFVEDPSMSSHLLSESDHGLWGDDLNVREVALKGHCRR